MSEELLLAMLAAAVALGNGLTRAASALAIVIREKITGTPRAPNGRDAQRVREAMVQKLDEVKDVLIERHNDTDRVLQESVRAAEREHERMRAVLDKHDERAHDSIVRVDRALASIAQSNERMAAILEELARRRA